MPYSWKPNGWGSFIVPPNYMSHKKATCITLHTNPIYWVFCWNGKILVTTPHKAIGYNRGYVKDNSWKNGLFIGHTLLSSNFLFHMDYRTKKDFLTLLLRKLLVCCSRKQYLPYNCYVIWKMNSAIFKT